MQGISYATSKTITFCEYIFGCGFPAPLLITI